MPCRICDNPLLSQYFFLEKAPATIQNLPIDSETAKNCVTSIQVYSCHQCGLVQLNDSKLLTYYNEVIRSSGISKMMSRYRTNKFKKLFAYPSLKTQYIEFGAGGGENLPDQDIFTINNVSAVEDGADNRIKLKKFKINNIYKNSDLNSYSSPKFNRFGCFNFLEHLPNPKQYLRQMISSLEQGAIGIIEVPNFEAMQIDGVFNDFSLEHLSYFTRNSIELLLRISGFEILRISEELNGHILSCIVQLKLHKSALETHNFEKKRQFLKHEFLKLFEPLPTQKIGVWGIGHQSLTMFLELDFISRLDFAIDSALSKQGRYLPGTNLRIQSPADLSSYANPLLIINASVYNNEVEKIVLRDFEHVRRWVMLDNTNITIKERSTI